MASSHVLKQFLKEADIKKVAETARSITEAASHFGMNNAKFKKFASLYIDEKTGLNYYELIKDRKHDGAIKVKYDSVYKKNKKVKKIDLKLIVEGYKRNTLSENQLKFYLITNGFKKQCCEECGYDTKRSIDYKVPLKLVFRDGKKHNGKLDNIEFICFNCHFIKYPDFKKDADEIYSNEINDIGNVKEETIRIVDTSVKEIDIDFQKIKLPKKTETINSDDLFEFVPNKNVLK